MIFLKNSPIKITKDRDNFPKDNNLAMINTHKVHHQIKHTKEMPQIRIRFHHLKKSVFNLKMMEVHSSQMKMNKAEIVRISYNLNTELILKFNAF